MYTEYDDFYLHVGWPSENGLFPIQVVQSPRGETRQPVWQENKLCLPAYQHILDYLNELIAEPEQVEFLGKSLYEFLFPGEIDEIFHRCRQDKEKGLRIRLRIDPEELSLFPWEYCYDQETRQYLALERQTPIVRYIAEGFAAPTTLSMPRPVKLLVVLSAPKDQPELDMDREEDGIRQALHNVPVQLTVLRHATIEKLHDALLEVEPHIVHFSGHGVLKCDVGALALENPQTGDTDALTARQMRSLLSRMGITLAVLNACETARHSTRDALMGVAQALIREEIPAVIAMQFLVSETVALMFTRRLYEFLFRGDPLEKIITETRVGIDINTEQDRISWGIPVLFMRARDGFLWKPEIIEKGSGLDSLVTSDLNTRSALPYLSTTTTSGILLKKIYQHWIIDVLARSIPNAERRIEFVLQSTVDENNLPGSSIYAEFDDLGQSLLLLGAPGAGKTIALCELARDLIARTSQDIRCPIPVILRLATWRKTQNYRLQEWINDQLKVQYGMGQTHIDEIMPRGFILLLDGLDEVRPEDQASCVSAINEYCVHEGWFNLVVTCREGEYSDLVKGGRPLSIPEKQVIRIVPLEFGRIDAFLKRLDNVGIDVTHLYSLLENECTPLMTDVILQTYEGRSGVQVQDIAMSDIWGKYVERKFEDEIARRKIASSELPYPTAQTKKSLGWLAHQLTTHTQDQQRFFLEEIQPNWLPGAWAIGAYGLTFGAILTAAYLIVQFVMSTGMPIFYGQERSQGMLANTMSITVPLASLWIVVFIWTIARRSASYFGPLMVGLITGIVFGSMIWVPYREMPILALVGGSITTLIVIPLIRFIISILGYSDKQIVCVKRRKWNWTKAGSGLLVGIIFVNIIGLVSDVTRAMFYDGLGFWPALARFFTFDTVVWWNWGLPGLLSMGLFLGLVFGMSWGDVVLRDEVDQPNQGIKDSGRNGLIVGTAALAAGLIFSLGVGLPCYLGLGWKASTGRCAAGELSSLFSGLSLGIGSGLILALIFGIIFGGFAWIRHYIVRLMLNLDQRKIPWRFEKFLKFASKLHLLRSVGGGFEFIDQELAAFFRRSDPN